MCLLHDSLVTLTGHQQPGLTPQINIHSLNLTPPPTNLRVQPPEKLGRRIIRCLPITNNHQQHGQHLHPLPCLHRRLELRLTVLNRQLYKPQHNDVDWPQLADELEVTLAHHEEEIGW
jgi:hypothetical protein